MITLEDVYKKINDDVKLTKKIAYTHKTKTKNKSINISLGRIWFNTLLPDDFPLVNEVINKKELDDIIKKIFKKYGPEKSVKIISKIQKEAFKLATLIPNTFNIEGLIIPDELEKKKEKFKEKAKTLSYEEYKNETDKLVREFIKFLDKNNFTLQNVLEGGVKGNAIDDWKSLLISKGYIIDIEEQVLGPIKKGISDGLTGEEYYQSSAGARRGFYYKSTAVQAPGYLARQVITASANLTLDNKDCRTKKYLEIKVTKQMAEKLIGRFYLDKGKITEATNVKPLINKIIKIRSPLYCKSKKGICKICYGKLSETLKSNNIGILAGGAINNIVVNKMMKMRHKSAQIDVQNVNFIKEFKNSKIDIKQLSLIFDIQETKINAKSECRIVINKEDYDEKSLMNSSGHYILPGIIEVYFGNGNNEESITFPFTFKVNLNKPKDISFHGKIINLNYSGGENIINKKTYVKNVDPSIVNKLFGGGLKFIKSPEILLNILYDELPNIDLVHLELIISNMFRNADDLTELCRLSSYKNFKILSQKQIPFETSWLNALAFENISKAIESGLVSNKDAELNSLEKLIINS